MLCYYIAVKKVPIRFDRLDSIYRLHGLLSEIMEGFRHGTIKCTPANVSRAFGEHWSGRCIRMKKKGAEKTVCPIFGVYYKSDPPVIGLSFDKNWCRPVYQTYRKSREVKNLPFVVSRSEGEVRFELDKEKFDYLQTASLSRQKAVLAEFLKTAADAVSPLL